jgi:hypothetical protein
VLFLGMEELLFVFVQQKDINDDETVDTVISTNVDDVNNDPYAFIREELPTA